MSKTTLATMLEGGRTSSVYIHTARTTSVHLLVHFGSPISVH